MANLDEIQIKISQDSSDASKAIDSLISSLEKLSKATELGKTAENIKSLSGSVDSLSNASKKLGGIDFVGKMKGFANTTVSTLKSLAGWGVSLTVIGKQLANSIGLASDYMQTVKMLNATMGEGAEEAKKFAEELGDVLGLNPADTMKFQATFQNLFIGFGNNAKQAQIMSKNLTQLSYDMATFYGDLVGNDPQAAAEKLRLGVAGTIEPIQRLGYAIKEADLQAVAARQGLNVNIRNLNTASKSMLRYIAIMEQSTHVQGDMARSFDSPATAMIVFKSSIKQLSTEVGETFLPMLMATIPYMQAFVRGLLNMIKTINSILGIELPKIGTDEQIEGISGIGDEAEKTGKKIQKAFTLGIDELNVLDSSATDAGAGMQDITKYLKLPEYNMLEGFGGDKVKEIEDKLKPLEPLFNGMADAFAGFYDSVSWLTGDVFYPWLVDVGNWMKKNPDTMENIGKGLGLVAAGILALKGAGAILNPILDFLTASNTPYVVGITLAVTGTILEIEGLKSALEEGFNKINLTETIGGEALIIGAATLLGKKFGTPFVGAALGAVVAGIPAFIVGLKDAFKNGFSGFNLIDILFSGGAIVSGITTLGMKFAPEIAVALAGIFGDDVAISIGTALAGGTLTAAISGIVLGLPTFILGVIDAIKGIDIFNSIAVALGATATGAGVGAIIGAVGGPIGAGIGALIGLIVGALTDLGIWIYQNWDTVKAKTSEIWEGIKSFFTTKIPEIVSTIVNFFLELPSKIGYAMGYVLGVVVAWGENVVNWAIENVPKIISTVVTFFQELPSKIFDTIKELLPKLSEWAKSIIVWTAQNLPIIINNIVNWFNKLPENLLKIGKNMVIAIWNGIVSAGDWLKDKIKGFLGVAWEAVSGMFEGFGEGLTEGYESVAKYEVEVVSKGNDKEIEQLSAAQQNLVDTTLVTNEQLEIGNEIQSTISELTMAGNKTMSQIPKDLTKQMTTDTQQVTRALEDVEDACRNIKIEVHKHYGGGDGYASGGFPTSGEMFFAREDGLPEMVGRVGRQTAVMNNGQIADTMAQSLVRAMGQGGVSQQPTVIENKLYLDGEVVYNNQQKIQRSKGYNLGMGVFANV